MKALPDDSWLLTIRPQPAPVTAEEYDALPEEIARAIEIVDGYVRCRASPTIDHKTAARRLADLLERYARAAMADGHECVEVNADVDLRLRDLPLHNRRPDVVLFRGLGSEREWLDRAARLYKHTGTFMKDESGDDHRLGDPFPVVIEWSELRF